MADFTKFGQDGAEVVAMAAGNMNRQDAASFLMLQQAALQNDAIDQRVAGKANAGGGQKAGTQAGKSMLDQMRAMMNSK